MDDMGISKKKSPVPSPPLFINKPSLQSPVAQAGFSNPPPPASTKEAPPRHCHPKQSPGDTDATKFWWTQTVTNTQSVYM